MNINEKLQEIKHLKEFGLPFNQYADFLFEAAKYFQEENEKEKALKIETNRANNEWHDLYEKANTEWQEKYYKAQERIKELEEEKGASFETANLEAGWIKQLESELSEKRIKIAELERKILVIKSAKEACNRNEGAMRRLAGTEE